MKNNLVVQTKENTVRLAIWTGAWLITTALASFGPKLIWDFNNLISVSAILLNILVGAGMIWANKRFLQDLDELQQKIQLEAMALALGIGLILGLGYSLLDIAQVISFDAEISHLIIVMSITYLIGMKSGQVRYR